MDSVREILLRAVTIVRLGTRLVVAVLVFHRPAKNSRWPEDTAREGVPVFSSTHHPRPHRRIAAGCSAFSRPRGERSSSDAPDASLLLGGGEPGAAVVASRVKEQSKRWCGVGRRGRTGTTTAITAALAPRANREIYVELCIHEYRNAYLHRELIRVIVAIFSVDERSIIVALSRGKHVSPGRSRTDGIAGKLMGFDGTSIILAVFESTFECQMRVR